MTVQICGGVFLCRMIYRTVLSRKKFLAKLAKRSLVIYRDQFSCRMHGQKPDSGIYTGHGKGCAYYGAECGTATHVGTVDKLSVGNLIGITECLYHADIG